MEWTPQLYYYSFLHIMAFIHAGPLSPWQNALSQEDSKRVVIAHTFFSVCIIFFLLLRLIVYLLVLLLFCFFLFQLLFGYFFLFIKSDSVAHVDGASHYIPPECDGMRGMGVNGLVGKLDWGDPESIPY